MFSLCRYSNVAYTACSGRKKKRAVSLIDEEASEISLNTPEIKVSRVDRYFRKFTRAIEGFKKKIPIHPQYK